MIITIERTRFSPTPTDDPLHWDIGFKVTVDDVEYYCPTTVYKYQLPHGATERNIMTVAAKECLPNTIGMIYDRTEAQPDFFDTLAKSLENEHGS